MFRLLCKRLRDRSDDHEKTLYKNWVLGVEVGEGRFLTTDLLIQLASQFRIIKGKGRRKKIVKLPRGGAGCRKGRLEFVVKCILNYVRWSVLMAFLQLKNYN